MTKTKPCSACNGSGTDRKGNTCTSCGGSRVETDWR